MKKQSYTDAAYAVYKKFMDEQLLMAPLNAPIKQEIYQPKHKYNIIFADPPWWYNNRKTGGERKDKTKFGGGAQKHYPLMKDQELLALSKFISDLSADNCALFLWTTYPRLDFAIELLKTWGFRYTTAAFHWVKTRKQDQLIFGPGYYTASNPEVVLLGIKGSMEPIKKMLPSVYLLPRMEHSRKPDKFYSLVEEMYPNTRKIELFARRQRENWDVWGNEVEEEEK